MTDEDHDWLYTATRKELSDKWEDGTDPLFEEDTYKELFKSVLDQRQDKFNRLLQLEADGKVIDWETETVVQPEQEPMTEAEETEMLKRAEADGMLVDWETRIATVPIPESPPEPPPE